jgi:hypothetical protein
MAGQEDLRYVGRVSAVGDPPLQPGALPQTVTCRYQIGVVASHFWLEHRHPKGLLWRQIGVTCSKVSRFQE